MDKYPLWARPPDPDTVNPTDAPAEIVAIDVFAAIVSSKS